MVLKWTSDFLGLILAKQDPLHLTQIVCDIIGIPRKGCYPQIRWLSNHGHGAKTQLMVVGVRARCERVRIHKVSQFPQPSRAAIGWINLPAFLKRALKNASGPLGKVLAVDTS